MPTGKRPLHFVLVQRPENLAYPKFLPGCFPFPGVVPSKPEEMSEEDSLLVAEHGAARLNAFLTQHGVSPEAVFVYNGKLTKQSPNLTHLLHARDYLFVNPVDGKITTPEDYTRLQSELNGDVFVDPDIKKYDLEKEPLALRKARRERCRTFITRQLDEVAQATGRPTGLQPLEELYNFLDTDECEEIVAFALAPLTSLAALFKMGDVLREKLVRVYGQLFAWDNCSPQAVNILKNQFNVDCDTDAVESVLTQFPLCKKLEHIVLVPTEVIKNPKAQALFDDLHQELSKTPVEKLSQIGHLWRQWNVIKGNKAQPIFDPAVIFLWDSMETDGYDKTYANKLCEMTAACVIIPDNQSDYKWNRTVFGLTPGNSVGMKIRAAVRFTEEGFEEFKKMTRDQLGLLTSLMAE
jgi:hypothetical protein